jgi:hypothetical protein
MSQENVEIVKAAHPPSWTDVMARARIELATPRFSVENQDEKMWPWLQGLS